MIIYLKNCRRYICVAVLPTFAEYHGVFNMKFNKLKIGVGYMCNSPSQACYSGSCSGIYLYLEDCDVLSKTEVKHLPCDHTHRHQCFYLY